MYVFVCLLHVCISVASLAETQSTYPQEHSFCETLILSKNTHKHTGNGGSHDKCRRRWDLADSPILRYKVSMCVCVYVRICVYVRVCVCIKWERCKQRRSCACACVCVCAGLGELMQAANTCKQMRYHHVCVIIKQLLEKMSSSSFM